MSQQFEPFNPRRNREKIRQFWSEIKMGYPLDQFFKPLLVSRQAEYGEKARP